jgi:hypothetical protein
MKEKKQVVSCSYTGDIQSTSTSVTTEASGGENVVGVLDLSIKKLNKDQLKKLAVCFNSAYWVAKNEMPFTMYPSVLELQQINGVDLAKSYKSDKACSRYININNLHFNYQLFNLDRSRSSTNLSLQ